MKFQTVARKMKFEDVARVEERMVFERSLERERRQAKMQQFSAEISLPRVKKIRFRESNSGGRLDGPVMVRKSLKDLKEQVLDSYQTLSKYDTNT